MDARCWVGLVASLWICGTADVLLAEDPLFPLRIATWNVEWFFDHVTNEADSRLIRERSAPSREDWDWKCGEVAEVIAALDATIVCLQEVESRWIVFQLAQRLRDRHGQAYRIAFIEGWDTFSGQDVTILYRTGLIRYSVREPSEEEMRTGRFYHLNKHLFGDFEFGPASARSELTVLNVLLRPTTAAHRVRERQAALAHHWLAETLAAGTDVVLVGGLNLDGGETSGPATPLQLRNDGLVRVNLTGGRTSSAEDDMVDLTERLPPEGRATKGDGSRADAIFVSPSLLQDTPGEVDLVFASIRNRRDLVVRGDVDRDHERRYWSLPTSERDVSDHFPLVAQFEWK